MIFSQELASNKELFKEIVLPSFTPDLFLSKHIATSDNKEHQESLSIGADRTAAALILVITREFRQADI